MKTLAVVTNLPTPYRVPLFELLATRLRPLGWELEVVFGSRTNARRRWAVDERSFGFRHRFLEAANVRLKSDRIVNTYGGLADALEEMAPDAVVCTGFSRGTMVAARHAARREVPWALWSGAVEGSEPGLLRRVQRRWLVRRCPRFLAYGSAARDYLRGLGAPDDRIHVAWNTVDTTPFLRLDRKPEDGPFRFLTVGYLQRGKRIDLLLRALAAARARGADLALDVVGDGPERAALEAQAADLPVRFHGHVPYTGLGARYEAAHAFAFPTEYDVWGLALLEAMAAGLPALASVRAGATRDLVVDGETGYAVDWEDTDAVADRMVELAHRPGDAALLGRNGRARIAERFTLDRSVDGWLELVAALDAPPRVRVLHWYWQRHAGGIDRVVKDLARSQAGNPALDVAVATGCANGGAADEDRVTVLGFEHGFDFRRLARLKELLGRTDVFHMHCYNPVVALAARRAGVPVVYTDHGTDHARHPRNLLMVWWLQRRFVHKRARLVTVNSAYRRALQQDFYDRPLRLVYNGLDFTDLKPRGEGPARRAEFGIGPGEFVVGTVALYQERKRVPLLVDVFADFVGRNPGVRARLLVVGDGSERETIRRHVARSGVEDRVLLAGFRSDARALIEAIDVFVLPTVGEPFGLAAVEALALERPTLVFADGGGLVEIVKDGETGFVVADRAEAVRRIEQLRADPGLGRRLGRDGRADVVARFDISAMEAAVSACYADALA